MRLYYVAAFRKNELSVATCLSSNESILGISEKTKGGYNNGWLANNQHGLPKKN